MRKLSKNMTATLVAGAVVVAGGGIAYAYWTTTGSGTGTVTAAPVVANVVVKQTSVITNLGPGIAAQTLTGNFDNGGTGPAYIGTVTASIGTVTKDAGAATGTCDASDFVLANPIAYVNAEIPVGTGKGAWSGPTIAFNNTSSNQSQCKLATVVINYVASGPYTASPTPTSTSDTTTDTPTTSPSDSPSS